MNAADSRGAVDVTRLTTLLHEGGFTGPKPVLRATTASTNVDAAALEAAGAQDFQCVQAEEQQAGRGRLAREWASPPGAGLWCSTIIPTAGVPASRLGWLPLLAGLAACDAVTGAGIVLKWPNDLVVLDGATGGVRKLGGILVERQPSGRAVVGIGINVAVDAADLPFPNAASLLSEGGDLDRTTLLARLLPALQRRWRQWLADDSALRADYLARCVTIGRPVRVEPTDGAAFTGIATGIEPGGGLLVEEGTTTRTVTAADVIHATIAP